MKKNDRTPSGSRYRQINKSGRFQKRKLKNPDKFIWGIHPILEVLRDRPDSIKAIFSNKKNPGPKLREVIDLARQHGVKISFEAEEFADILTKTAVDRQHHQGVIACGNPFVTLSLAEMVVKIKSAAAPFLSPPVVLVLDNVQDPHNLGAMIRSGLAAGVTGVIIPKDRSAPLSGTVFKASAGAAAHVNICQVANLVHTLKVLKREGLWIFGSIKNSPLTIYQADFSLPLCLVMGSEEKGLRPLVKEQCDFFVSIPMSGRLDSLNASVAAGIILFEIVRRRQAKTLVTTGGGNNV